MKKPEAEGALELKVADFGPIVEAKVDLRPLTVFVGPSNTGKSYLAILTYALHQFFGGMRHRMGWRVGPRFRFDHHGPALGELSEESVDALLDMARSPMSDADTAPPDSITLPPPVAELLRSAFDRTARGLEQEVKRCFGLPDLPAITRKRKGRMTTAHVVMRRRMSSHTDFTTHTVTFADKTCLSTSIPSEVPIPVNVDGRLDIPDELLIDSTVDSTRRKHAAAYLLGSVSRMVLPSLVGPLYMPAYYLPADRTGIMHAHSVVVSSLIANAPTAGLRPIARTQMLSGVLADFLEQLIEIDRTWRHQKTRRDLGKKIEETILGGSVQIDRSAQIDYPRFAYRPQGWADDLALTHASSMVSELAPVVLYLRHMIGPDNVLIVEEPESHLHPAMQVEFTRQLAALITVGVRVIVTTHSEWLLEELANIVRRSELPKAERGDGIGLHPNQVGAWLFEPKQRPKGSVVKEICLEDSGLYPSGYDEVASALHNEWADISSRIETNS